MRRSILAACAASCLIAGGLAIAWELREQNVRELRTAERLLEEYDEASRLGQDGVLPYKRIVTLIGALDEVTSRANASEMAGIAELLADRIASEHSLAALPLWTRSLDEVQGAISEDLADRLAAKLTSRFELEANAGLLHPLAAALNVLANRVSVRQAEATARVLILRMQSGDVVHLTAGATGVAALGEKLPSAVLEQTRGLLVNALRKEGNATSVAALGLSLGEVSRGVAAGGFDEAVHIAASRMASQQGVYELFGLASALGSLTKVRLSPQAAASDAALLVSRLEREHQIPQFMRVGLGLEVLAPAVPAESAPTLVARLLERMESPSASIARALAFNIGDFGGGARTDQIHRAAAMLRQRIVVEQDASTLRLLVAGLINLGDRVPEGSLEEARERAETLLKAASNGHDREDLEAILRALHDRDDDDEEMADFHELLVNDDDGETKIEEEVEQSTRFVPVQSRAIEATPTLVGGVGLLIVGLLLSLALRRARSG